MSGDATASYKKFDDTFLYLSKRHIDILACLYSHQTTKQIATVLDIKPRTVEKHIFDLTQKFGFSSRINLIKTAQDSTYAMQLMIRYNELCDASEFKKFLKKSRQQLNLRHITCKIICTDNILKVRLKQDLISLGITLYERKSDVPIIYVVGPKDKLDNSPKTVRYKSNYFLLFFEILSELVDSPLTREAVNYFQKSKTPQFREERASKFLEDVSKTEVKYSRKIKTLSMLGVFCFLILGFSVYKKYFSLEILSGNLYVPISEKLIVRNELFLKIDEILEPQLCNKICVLVGIGGSGKTILARQYAKKQKAKLIFEINAGNKESILNCFRDLAYLLAKNQEEKKEIKNIQNEKKQEDYEKQLVLFIQKHLKKINNWVLIFDDLDDANLLYQYLPNNSTVWGNGKILITTRDSNISDTAYIHNKQILVVPELTFSEKMDLFSKIQSVPVKDKKQLTNFLNYLPSFPLDINVAAYHMQNTGCSYQEYIETFVFTDDFKNKNCISTNRYSIIKQALDFIAAKKLALLEPLLLISLLATRDIDKKIFQDLFPKKIVTDFIRNMSKESLLHCEKKDKFYIHQNIQIVIQQCILKNPENSSILKNVVNKFHNYINLLLEDENLEHLRVILPHILSFNKCIETIDPSYTGQTNCQLGCVYYHVGDFNKAEIHLNKSYSSFNQVGLLKSYQLKAMSYKASINAIRGNEKEAVKELQQCIEIYRRKYPQERSALAWTLIQYGLASKALGAYEQSKEALEKAVHIYTDLYGDNSSKTAFSILCLGDLSAWASNQEATRYYYQKSFEIYKKNLGLSHAKTAYNLFRLGTAYKYSGQYSKMLAPMEQAYKTYSQHHSENKSVLIEIGLQIADAYRILGDLKKAESILIAHINEAQKFFGKNTFSIDLCSVFKGRLLIEQKHYEEAVPLLEKILKTYEAKYAFNNIRTLFVMYCLAKAYLGLQQFEKAEELYKRCLQCYETAYAQHDYKTHIWYAYIRADLGCLYIHKKLFDLAEKFIQETLEIFEIKMHPDAYICYQYLGELYQAKGQNKKSQEAYLKARNLRRQYFGK